MRSARAARWPAALVVLLLLLLGGCETRVVNDGRHSVTGMNTVPTQTYQRPKPPEPTIVDHMVDPLRPVGRVLFGWMPSLPSLPEPAPAPPPRPGSTSYLGVTGKRVTPTGDGEALGVPSGGAGFNSPP